MTKPSRFKAIVSRHTDAKGTWAEVGMTDRLLVNFNVERHLRRVAREWAGDVPLRVEVFSTDRFYSDPLRTFYMNGGVP